MPGNTIKINNHENFEWYVGDSKMEELLSWLESNGEQIDNNECEVKPIDRERTLMELLDVWVRELTYPGQVQELIQEVSGSGDQLEKKRRFCFYTNDHKYSISAIERVVGKSYLGCTVTTRKPRAGEDWTRGNDLPDGDFTKETWDKIINSIVRYELQKLSDYTKPAGVPED